MFECTPSEDVKKLSLFVLMHKGLVHKNMFFLNKETARNWIKMNYPKRNFRECANEVFKCTRHGTTFKIVEIHHYSNTTKDPYD